MRRALTPADRIYWTIEKAKRVATKYRALKEIYTYNRIKN